jgi:transposase
MKTEPKTKDKQDKRIIGVDMHPDVFSAAALQGASPAQAAAQWVHDRQPVAKLEAWAEKHLDAENDTVVLEASGNSFEIAARLHRIGITAVVLESAQAAKVRENYCNDDRHSAVKLARVYMSGLAKIVWQPDAQTREQREVLFTHRNAVKDCTRYRNRIRSTLNEYCVRLPKGTCLTRESGLKKALSMREWTPTQEALLRAKFDELWAAEKRREEFGQVMLRELLARPEWKKLWRLMGIGVCTAYALMALVGNINRFPTAKKLAGYIGVAPGKKQSGNDAKGHDLGIGFQGRSDLRALIMQAAQNVMMNRASPLHRWGWRLAMRKERNVAVVAVARKLCVSVWHLLKGHWSELNETADQLKAKLYVMATQLGKKQLKEMKYENREAFVTDQLQTIFIPT